MVYFNDVEHLSVLRTHAIAGQLITEKVRNINYIYLLTYGAQPFLRSYQLCSHSRTYQHVMEPEGSLPCSQEPSTGHYPRPDRSSPYHPILSL
jgi:hypothetical protein